MIQKLPNLLVCGFRKCGTTTLHHLLGQHPEVFMSEEKEIYFFAEKSKFEKGVSWYSDHFKEARNELIRGESTPKYATHALAPTRIKELLPDVKLIFILRNPVERAYSDYWFNVSRGAQSTSISFFDVVQGEKGKKRYLNQGLYYKHLNKYFDLFKADQIHLILTEDLKNNPEQVLRSCFEFLQISYYELNFDDKKNETRYPKNKLVENLLLFKRKYLYHSLVWLPSSFKDKLKELVFKDKSKVYRSELSSYERATVAAYFKEDVDKLFHYLNRDKSVWGF